MTDMEAEAERLEREARDLQARYPGVRPGWVSEELAHLYSRARSIRESLPDDKKGG